MSRVNFEAPVSDDLIEAAAGSLAHQRLMRVIPLKLYIFSAVSVIAFVVGLVSSFSSLTTWIVGVVAIGPPVCFFLALNSRAREGAEMLKQRFQPMAQISLGPDSFSVAANDRTETMLWDDAKEITEFKDYFLVLMPRIGEVVVPRANMPAEGVDLVREAGRVRGILWMG